MAAGPGRVAGRHLPTGRPGEASFGRGGKHGPADCPPTQTIQAAVGLRQPAPRTAGTLTHSSEGQRAEGEVHDHVVGCDAAAGRAVDHPSDKLRKGTQAPGQQRPGPGTHAGGDARRLHALARRLASGTRRHMCQHFEALFNLGNVIVSGCSDLYLVLGGACSQRTRDGRRSRRPRGTVQTTWFSTIAPISLPLLSMPA